jgi:hypothetical protein
MAHSYPSGQLFPSQVGKGEPPQSLKGTNVACGVGVAPVAVGVTVGVGVSSGVNVGVGVRVGVGVPCWF